MRRRFNDAFVQPHSASNSRLHPSARARTGNQPKQPAASANQCCLPRGAEEKEEEEEATEQKGASKTSAVFEPLDNPQKPVHIETDE
jgi:hypothetical protein